MSLKELISKRAGYLGAVTKQINNIRACMLHPVAETRDICAEHVQKLLTQKKRFDEVHDVVMNHKELEKRVAGNCEDGANRATHGVVSVLDDYEEWTTKGPAISSLDITTSATGLNNTGMEVQQATLSMLAKLHGAIDDMRSESVNVAVRNALEEQHLRHKRETDHLYGKIDSLTQEIEKLSLLKHVADPPRSRQVDIGSHTDEVFKDVDYRGVGIGASTDWRNSAVYSSTRRSSQLNTRPSLGRGRARGRRTTDVAPQVGQKPMDNISWNVMETTAMMRELMSQSVMQNSTLVAQMQAPKVTMTKFDGSPLEFARFMNTFDELVHNTYDNDRSRLLVLHEQCTGKAREAIAGCMFMESTEGYTEAKRILARRFGAAHVVTQCWLDKLLSYPQLEEPEVIGRFATDVECCKNSLVTLGSLNELENVRTLQQIVCKMPLHMRNRWRKLNRSHQNKDASKADLLVELLRDASSDAEDPAFSETVIQRVRSTYATSSCTPKTSRNQAAEYGKKVSVFATDYDPESVEEAIEAELHAINRAACAACKSGQHFTSRCRRYRDMSAIEKLNFVREKQLCLLCLSETHMATNCPLPWKCQEKTCGRKHHTSLHASFEGVKDAPKPQVNHLAEQVTCEDGELECHGESYATVAAGNLPIVKVTVRYGNHSTCTYALMDPGSTVTLCKQSIVEDLGIRTDGSATLTIRTVNGHSRMTCDLASFHVSEFSNKLCYTLHNAMIVEQVKVSIDTLADLETIKAYPHLRNLRFHRGDEEEIGLLIGQNNAHLLEPIETIKGGSPLDPYAVGTPLGWILYGSIREDFARGDVPIPPPLGGAPVWNPAASINSIDVCAPVLSIEDNHAEIIEDGCVYAGCGCDEVCISEAIGRMGCLEEVPVTAKELTSEEQHVLELWEREMYFEDGHIVLPIPFKCEPPDLINNFVAAYRSLIHLGKHLLQHEKERLQYRDAVYGDFDNGHAEVIHDPNPALTKEAWYLLHHGVDHPRKPNITRVVKHGAAEYKGYSLSKATFKCPDLLNGLTDVLTRFRQFKTGATSDIEGMFNQVLTPEKHRDYSRFLFWEDGDPRKRIIVCRMRTHTFGTTWAPAAANFALKKTAQLFAKDQAGIRESIEKEFYVDDWMGSQPTPQESAELLTGVRAVVAKGGFNMQKIASNSREVIDTFPVNLRVKELAKIDIFQEKLPPGVMLGQGWLPETDEFTFCSSLEPKPFTRRGMTSCISSLFDPLGLIAPFILPAKLLLQASCRTGQGWDEELLEGTGEQWTKWIQQLPEIEEFRLRRWFGCDKKSRQYLHLFSDGSERAYGAVSFLAVQRAEGSDSTLVTAKSKIAPSKRLTIPKMEMAGAVLAVRLLQITRRMFGIFVTGVFLWVDSTIVLVLIRKSPDMLKTFMGNRVAYIQERTSIEQWGHVPGKINPADMASRGVSMTELNSSKLWHEGPDFLREDPVEWKKRQLRALDSVDISGECKKEKSIFHCDIFSADQCDVEVTVQECNAIKAELKEYLFRDPSEHELAAYRKVTESKSNWIGMIRTAVIFYRFALWWYNGIKGRARAKRWEEITVEEIGREELNVLAWAQTLEIPEVDTKTEAWKQLTPFHDKLWRVGGRFQYAELSTDVRHPIILPRTSAVTEVLIRTAHVKGGHGATDRTLLELRGEYWVIGGKPTVKKYVDRCVLCRRLKARPADQLMASLPLERGNPGYPVFWNSGVDLFGPVYVLIKRSKVKRYGAIFTCFNSRAVHLEPVEDLTASAFLDTLERFTLRRCKPDTLRSDNGTNFVAAEKEVSKAQKLFEDPTLQRALTNRKIKWSFNTPSASHQGGVWERLIRSVREILVSIIGRHTVSDARFHTVLTMAEAVMNGRPLTKLTNDVHDLEPLTPGHLIYGCRISPVMKGEFPADRLRQDWQLSQGLASDFWNQWMALYIPTLQRRSKWLQERDNVKVGEMVLVVADQYPRYEWPLGIVRDTHPGRDGFVRNVTVRTAAGLSKRPIQKIVRLELDVGDG